MSESFADMTRNLLCSINRKKSCCRAAELYGMLLFSNCFSREKIRITAANDAVKTLCEKMIKGFFGKGLQKDCGTVYFGGALVFAGDKKKTAKNPSENIPEESAKSLEELFGFFGYQPEDDLLTVKSGNFKCDGCISSFIRGVYLACGTVTLPKSGYHLEMRTPHRELALALSEQLAALSLEPKITARSGDTVLYYKESEAVEDFLNYIGAQRSAFEIMNRKIFKDIRNNANRLANCDAANIEKTISSAANQINAINAIIESGKINLLPPELRETAILRSQNSEMSLKELAGIHKPPLTKSGVNHRLGKIVDFYKSMQIETEDKL